jgi:hypothetical protein
LLDEGVSPLIKPHIVLWEEVREVGGSDGVLQPSVGCAVSVLALLAESIENLQCLLRENPHSAINGADLVILDMTSESIKTLQFESRVPDI